MTAAERIATFACPFTPSDASKFRGSCGCAAAPKIDCSEGIQVIGTPYALRAEVTVPFPMCEWTLTWPPEVAQNLGLRCSTVRKYGQLPVARLAHPFRLDTARSLVGVEPAAGPGFAFIERCNLENRHEGCRTWAGLAVPAAVEAPAHAVTETATRTRMHKAGASEPRMEEARVTKAEASEDWTEKAAAEPAVPASAKSDGNSDRPSPAPWVTPTPARCIIRVIPGVILWRIIRIALCLNGGASR